MRRLWVLILVGALASLPVPTHAFFGDKFKKLDIDMSYEEVQKILGKPDGKQRHGSYVVWKYFHRMVTGWRWDRADYMVVFKGDKVVEYGPGDIRMIDVQGVPTVVLVPLR